MNAIPTNEIDDLAYTSALSSDEKVKSESQQKLRNIAKQQGIYSQSMHEVYMAFGRGELSGFTVPAMNVRMLTYDFAHTAFKVAIKHNVGCMIFEIANSEQQYTDQPPSEFSSSIIAGALKAGYKGPIFLQGDHYQMNASKFGESPESEIERIKHLIRTSLDGLFYNIDIDCSTLVDLDKPTIDEQQKNNYEMTAIMTRFIRNIQPEDVMVSIGGEIGHIGGRNSTAEDFEAFMQGYLGKLQDSKISGISKVALQTGTSHGGIPLPDGTLAEVSIDFDVIETIGNMARSTYGLGGPVQHGASTLPDELFHKFPAAKTLEIHLATEFQNIVYAHMNEGLKQKMWAWLRENAKEEMKENMTDEQFIYKSRKKAWGHFKNEVWNMPPEEKQPIMSALEKKLEYLFTELHVLNTKDAVSRFV